MYRRGLAHEAAHRASFPSAIDLSDGSPDDRARRTIEAVRAGAEAVYHGYLRATARIMYIQDEHRRRHAPAVTKNEKSGAAPSRVSSGQRT